MAYADDNFEDVCRAEIHGKDAPDSHLRLWDAFSATASKYPSREAIVSLWEFQPLPEGLMKHATQKLPLRWTYRELFEKSTHIATMLKGFGCRPGMRLGTLLWNSADWGVFLWAAANIGMIFAPIDPRVHIEARSMLVSFQPDVIVCQSSDEIAIIDGIMGLSVSCLQIHCSSGQIKGWLGLQQLYSSNKPPYPSPSESIEQDEEINDEPALVVFTSGTTESPKGCLHTNQNLMSQTNEYDPNLDPTLIDRWLVHTPISHIFAINNALRAWRLGDAVVFPSKSFDVNSTLRALVEEKCTVMSATPTLVRSILAHPKFPGANALYLRVISIASTTINTNDIQMSRSGLGSKDAIQAYGMSEGAPLVSWSRTDKLLVNGFHPGVGRILPGGSIRICQPFTNKVLRRGEIGEIHVGGPSVISQYLGGLFAESFYNDNGRNWLITGDQGALDKDGVLHVLGRYKDVIIRGGEKINPLYVEPTLSEIPGVQAFVIGVPNKLEGELPVAVAKLPENVSKNQLQEKARYLGSKYALDAVYTLSELGLDDFPKTSMGKVKRGVLKKIVAERRVDREPQQNRTSIDPGSMNPSRHSLTKDLLNIWENLTGTRPTATDKMSYFADSITLLRYCDAVFRFCGRCLYLTDLVEHDTVLKQAQLLCARGKTGVVGKEDLQEKPNPKVGVESVFQLVPAMSTSISPRNKSSLVKVQDFSSESHVLHPSRSSVWEDAESHVQSLGLGSSVIEDIIPIRDALHRTVVGQRPESYHVRLSFRIRHAGPQRTRRGLEKALSLRPMLRAVLFKPSNGTLNHLVIGTSHQLLEKLLTEIEVMTDDDAKLIWQKDTIKREVSDYMCHADIIRVRNSGNVYLSMDFNHSVIDAMSLWSWHQDLDNLIYDLNAKTVVTTPFKLFSDVFGQYEDSKPAQKSVAFHVNQLRGISRLKKSLWPVQRAPGWMISNDQGSKVAEDRKRVRNAVWNGEWQVRGSDFTCPRLGRVVYLPQLRQLRKYGIKPCLFAKCSITIFNILQTRSCHALFNTWEGGRSWPFVPPWMQSILPAAMSIDGPTAQWVLNMIEVLDNETILEFLQRIHNETETARQYHHVPWGKVVEGLSDEGDVAIDASFRQSFVWDVSLGASNSKGVRGDFNILEPISRFDWADCGFFWNAFMLDKENLYFVASWDTAQMDDNEAGRCCDSLSSVMRALCDEDNWNRQISQVFARP